MDHAAHTQHTEQSAAIARLLEFVRGLAGNFVAAFGDPLQLLSSGRMMTATRDLIAARLRDMETLIRRILFLLAARLAAPPLGSARKTPAPQKPRKIIYAYEVPGADPMHWRVNFQLCPRGPSAHRPKAQTDPYAGFLRLAPCDRAPPAWLDDPRTLAERFEALLRVLKNPEPYAMRLSRRLHAWRDEKRQFLLRALRAGAHGLGIHGGQNSVRCHLGGAGGLALEAAARFKIDDTS